MTTSYPKIIFTNKQLLTLIIPLIIEQLLAIAVGFADSIMVATVGESAVSAVSLVDTINVLLFSTFSALATGGAVVAGQYIGSRKFDKANDTANQLLMLLLGLSLAVTLILFVFRVPLLHLLFGKIDQDVMTFSNTYYLIVEASIPFMALYNVGAALFRIMGNSSISMRISILMNIINVGGNACLIFGFHFGVEGVAIPTLVSKIIGAFIAVYLMTNQSLKVHISKSFKYRFNKTIIKNIIRVGVPNGLENGLFQLGKVLLLSVVSVLGTASIAANAIGNTVGFFQITAAFSIGFGLVTVVSQCVGAKDFESAKFYTRKLMIWAYIATLISNILVFLLMPGIIKLYGLSKMTGKLATTILLIHGGFSIVLYPLSFTLPQTLKAAGDTTFTMLVATVSMWTFRIGFGILFARVLNFGVVGIWMAMMIDWIFRVIIFTIRYFSNKWQHKYIRA